jgi:hypothetical protein
MASMKAFEKDALPTFYGNQKRLVTMVTIRRAIEIFALSSSMPPHWMVIEEKLVTQVGMVGMIFFQKMLLHAPPLFGHQKNSVAIQHTPIIKWQPKGV